MGRNINARMLERIWFFVEQRGAMRTDLIQQHYANTYGDNLKLASMTQTLLSSGLFKRAGWYNRVHDEMIETTLSSNQMGIKDPAYVCVVEAKSLDEVVAGFRDGRRTLRKINKMPSFVRDAVEESL
jgi:phosphomevalonate kinase